MSSSVVVLETKAARVSLARPVHCRTHKFLETPVTQAKRGSSCVQVSFVNCPQPRSISNSPAFLACMFCFPIADHAMLPQRTISFKCRSWWLCRWLWPHRWAQSHPQSPSALFVTKRFGELSRKRTVWRQKLLFIFLSSTRPKTISDWFPFHCVSQNPNLSVYVFWMIYLPLPISPLTINSRFEPREGEATQQSFIRGGSSPRSNPSSLSVDIDHFWKKRYPFSISSIGYLWQKVPFSHT